MAKKAKKKAKAASGSKEVEEGKACSILAYLIIGLIWYFVDDKMKKNSFANYHVKQGLVFLLGAIVYHVALSIILTAIFVPLLFTGGGFGLLMILRLLYYVPLIFLIIGIINAANGNKKELPIIGKFGKNFTF
jgi:uncharacterized membrane protein